MNPNETHEANAPELDAESLDQVVGGSTGGATDLRKQEQADKLQGERDAKAS